MASVDETLAADVRPPPSGQDTLDGGAGQSHDAPTNQASRARPVAAGDRIGRYLVLARIGAGGMGEVFAAYDPELDRKIALKLLHPERAGPGASSTVGRTRLLREAQAMARLQHPNTVAVHDVGEHEGRVFLAMEFIAGSTLGEWLAARPRSWRELVPVFVAAGRGLAAAHAAKLIHRDFKPDNVMVGNDGRVRVMDFGLARAREPSEASASVPLDRDSAIEQLRAELEDERPKLSTTLTARGSLTGTPAYMAPEQFINQPVDARTDQFAFCVALYEALTGERPFPGESPAALAFSVVQGQRRELSAGAEIPSWLRRAIDRGLASDPDQRWPKLDMLLAELERDRSRRWRTAALVGGALALLGLATVPWFGPWLGQREAEVCAGGRALMAELWSEAQASAAEQAVRATGLEHAAETWARTAPQLDAWRDAWLDARRVACEATRVHREQSEALMEARMRCLDRQRRVFAVLVDDLADADADVVEGAVEAAQGLPAIERCADLDHVEAEVVPPEDPQVAAAVEQLRRELAHSERLRRVAPAERRAEVEALRERAAALDYAPVLAEAQLRLGRLHAEQARGEDAVAALRAAYFEGRALGLDEVARDAAIELVFATGELEAEHERALEWAAHARAEIARSGTDDDEARRLDLLAQVHMAMGRNAEAEAELRRALELHQGARGKQDADSARIHLTLADLLQDLARYDEARAEFERGGELVRAELGEGHPRLGLTWLGLAQIAAAQSRYDEALALLARAEALWSKTLPEQHPWLGDLHNDRAMVLHHADDIDAAGAELERALELRRASLGPDHPAVAAVLTNLGSNHSARGEAEQALAHYNEALAIHERAGTSMSGPAVYLHVQLAMDLLASGDLDGARARADVAEQAALAAFSPSHDMVLRARVLQALLADMAEDHGRVVTLMLDNLETIEAQSFPTAETTVISLMLLAQAEHHLGLHEQALEHVERALAVEVDGPGVNQVEATLLRAQVLWVLGLEAEAREAAEQGLGIASEEPQLEAAHAASRAWLRAH